MVQESEDVSEVAARIANQLKLLLGDLSQKSALAFSGGLDSTVLMVASGKTLVPYTAGFPESKDILNSRQTADILKFKMNEIQLNLESLRKYRDVVMELDPRTTLSEIGYEIVLSAVLDRTSEKTVVTGQGADEIFYGYRRFLDDSELMNSGHLEKLYVRTLPREKKIAAYYGKKLVTPYLDKQVTDLVSPFDRNAHIIGNRNKVILREVARCLGIPELITERPKKAAQFGSGVSKALIKI